MEIVKIDLVPSGVMPSCHASQYDIGREIRFLLTDGGEEYTLAGTETISIELRKPDGTSETIAIENTSSNYVDWETSDGELDLSGVYLAEISIKNGDDVLGSANFIVKTEADAYDGADVRTVTVGPADICTFETTLAEPLQSVLVNVVATGGNGTPDNPNPINGYTEANITRCGVNLWDERYQLGEIYPSGAINPDTTHLASLNYIQVKPNTNYILFGIRAQVGAYDIQKNFIGIIGNSYIGTNGGSVEFTTPANCVYLLFNAAASYGTTYNNDISILYPSDTTPAYHPYNGQTYTVAFGQTVYGGVPDVTRGKLHVTYGYVPDMSTYNFSKELSGGKYHYYSGQIPDAKHIDFLDVPGALCSNYPTISRQALYAGTLGCAFDNTSRFYVYNADYDNESTTATDVKNDMSGVSVAYELAAPFDIDLTPEVISAIVGTNNVFADCGQSTVKYLKAGV